MAELLKTLDEKTAHPPKSRIGDGFNAGQFVFRLIQADQTRAIYRTKVKGQVDGNAPYGKAELAAKGMPSMTNLNFRQASAIINQYKTPYYDLLVEVPLLADIRTAFGTATERGDWSQIISEEYHRAVTTWEDWDFVSQFHQFQMLLHGVGVCFFRDKLDWRPDVARTGEVLVQDGAKSKTSELDSLVLLKNYTAPDIYRYIRNEQAARDLGWNIGATEKAIIEARFGSGPPPADQNAYEWYQQKFKNADLFFGTYDCETVRTGSLLIKEFDGRISHHIVRTDRVTEEFLFTKIGRFDSMSEVVCPFFYDIGDGTWHSINGLGKEIYAYTRVFDMLRGREIDGAILAASQLLQQKDAGSVTKAQLITLNNLSILPPGLVPINSNIGQGIEATVSVRRDMHETLSQNIGLIGRSPGTIDARKGQKQALAEMQQAAQLGKGNINRYYTAADKLHGVMYPRLANPNLRPGKPGAREAIEFQKRCLARGVPLQAMLEIDSIMAMRSIGAGSAANAINALEGMMQYADAFPEGGKDTALRLLLSRLLGTTTMISIMGPKNTSDADEDDSIAALENNALRTGGQVIITRRQSHVRHLEIHLGDAESHIKEVSEQAAQAGMEMAQLQGLFVHLDSAGKHCLEHLEMLKADPLRQTDFKALSKRWQQMSRVQDQIAQQLEEMQQVAAKAQESQTGQSPEDFLKLLNYKDAPESVKAQMEAVAGMPRQEGDLSVAERNLLLKQEATNLKAAKVNQDMEHNNISLATDLQQRAFENAHQNADLVLRAKESEKEPAMKE